MSVHDYGLEWIDQDALYEVTEHAFRNVIDKAESGDLQAPPDPFSTLTQAVLFDQSIESMMAFEKLRGINKSISNAVGNWHQAVLGLAEGWENLGSSGGVVDLFVSSSEAKRAMAVEVKNRYNTIKASDEKKVWDTLDTLARANGTTSYIIQIVPKTPERYDRPWKVSGRDERDHVRCCDGVTGYAWAFGRENALIELYEAFPKILADVRHKPSKQPLDSEEMIKWYYISMP